MLAVVVVVVGPWSWPPTPRRGVCGCVVGIMKFPSLSLACALRSCVVCVHGEDEEEREREGGPGSSSNSSSVTAAAAAATHK